MLSFALTSTLLEGKYLTGPHDWVYTVCKEPMDKKPFAIPADPRYVAAKITRAGTDRHIINVEVAIRTMEAVILHHFSFQ